MSDLQRKRINRASRLFNTDPVDLRRFKRGWNLRKKAGLEKGKIPKTNWRRMKRWHRDNCVRGPR